LPCSDNAGAEDPGIQEERARQPSWAGGRQGDSTRRAVAKAGWIAYTPGRVVHA